MKHLEESGRFWAAKSFLVGKVGEHEHWKVYSELETGNVIEYYEDGECKKELGLPWEPELLVAIGEAICALGKTNNE
jgi:hypothetical protein